MSPTSLKLTTEQIRRGRALNRDLAKCLQMEFRMTQGCVREASPDFAEGVRALLIDRDNSPKWSPSTLAGVSDGLIESFFAPLQGPGGESQELDLSPYM